MIRFCLNYLIFLLIIVATNKALAQSKDTLFVKDMKMLRYSKVLNETYLKGVKSKDNNFRIRYLSEMPNNFYDFNRLYGYTKDSSGLLYFVSYDHLSYAFEKLEVQLDSSLSNKIINLSINGKWEADAISMLQDIVEKSLKYNLLLMVSTLRKKSPKNIKSFWRFYFDGPHPPEKMPSNLIQIKALDPNMYQLMEAALKQKQKEWEH